MGILRLRTKGSSPFANLDLEGVPEGIAAFQAVGLGLTPSICSKFNQRQVPADAE